MVAEINWQSDERAKTPSVPLHRYSAPAVRGIEGVRQDDLLGGTQFLPLCRGIREGPQDEVLNNLKDFFLISNSQIL
jgi:hypothetical protein